MNNDLKPCPFCGRIPNIHTYGVNIASVECRLWYRHKAHQSTKAIYAQPSELFKKAAETWNSMVDSVNLLVRQGGVTNEDNCESD